MQTLDHTQDSTQPETGTLNLRLPVFGALHLHWEVAAYLVLVLVAAVMRFWDLGSRAQHHDESLHAVYSYYLYAGRGYTHDPLMHGPFQFHAVALIYLLFGDSDFTSRILPALLGTAAVGMPYFFRGYLGRTGALCAAVFTAFSPTLFYYSRFIRNDIYIALWNLLLVLGILRYMSTGNRLYALLAAGALSLGFATKEVTYLTVASFGSYLFLTSLREILPRLRRFDFRDVSNRTGITILIGTLCLPMASASAALIWGLEREFPDLGQSLLGALLSNVAQAWSGLWGQPAGPPSAAILGKAIAGGSVVAVLSLIAYVIGRRWNAPLWKQGVLVFLVVFVPLYSTFLTNIGGLGSGVWGSLEYWLEQHDVQRGSQPWYYYTLLIMVYEFLLLGLSVAGWLFFKLRRDRSPAAGDDPMAGEFTWFLLWWFATSLALYSFAGEKMPWLNVHMALPLALMAGKALGVFLDRVPWREFAAKGGVYLALIVAVLPFAFRSLVASTGALNQASSPLAEALQALAALCVLAFLAFKAVPLVRGLGGRLTMAAVAVVLLVAGGALTLRAGLQVTYAHGDIPVEMLVYTQTSPEIPRALHNIERIAATTGQREELPITVDSVEGFTWPWAWYLRHYKNVDYPDLSKAAGEPKGTVVMAGASNQQTMAAYADRFLPPARIPLRWWFPEGYDFGIARTSLQLPNGESLGAIVKDLTTAENWGRKWAYFMSRDLGTQRLGSSDILVFYPANAAAALGPTTVPAAGRPPEQPLAPAAGAWAAEAVLASAAQANGALQAPRSVAVDGDGNIYVVDSRRNRVVKVDATGRVLAQVGDTGAGDGQFNEPWGILVDASGNGYVADTWNHRIQKFDSNLRFLTKWGTFGEVQGGGDRSPGVFYGPRAMAMDKDGSLYITDTGNKRIQKFSQDGRFLAGWGASGRGPGQFAEPVGIAYAPDGSFLVADTWNRRVQRFDGNFQYLSEFPIQGWAGTGLQNKPYIAVEPEGNILVTDPDAHRITRYDRNGAPLGTYGKFGADLGSLNLPVGLAVDAEGRVVVADSGNSRVLRFPPLR